MFSRKNALILGSKKKNEMFRNTNVRTQNTSVRRNPISFRKYLQQRKAFILNGNIARRRIQAERRVGIDSAIKFNILIRNTYRPSYADKCLNSILSQSYQNFKIIMCYDDDYCLEYLNKYKTNPKIEIFKATDVDKNSGSAWYNLYCNQLVNRVKDGWIMYLDDDDMFATNNALKIIANSLKTTNDIVFWKVKKNNILIYPININNIIKDQITASGVCFHSKYKDVVKWKSQESGYYYFIADLLNNVNLNRKFIDKILT